MASQDRTNPSSRASEPSAPASSPSGGDAPTQEETILLAVSELNARSIPIPFGKEARRSPKCGQGVGLQRTIRSMLNAAACKKAGLPRNEELPISGATCAKILGRVRTILRSLHAARGEKTRAQLKAEADLSTVRRALEHYFPAPS